MMLKNSLIALSLLFSFSLSSQTFQILDTLENPIGATFDFKGSGPYLSATKVHVKNTGTVGRYFEVSVYEVLNPTNVDLQVCFDGGCVSVPAGTPSSAPAIPILTQLVAPGVIFDSLKIGPFAGAWVAGDSAIWDLTVFDTANVSNSVNTRIKWKYYSTVGVSSYEVLHTISIYPNPTASVVHIQVEKNTYSTIVLLDQLGKKVLERSFTNQLDVSTLPKGVYFLQLRAENQAPFVRKIVLN